MEEEEWECMDHEWRRIKAERMDGGGRTDGR